MGNQTLEGALKEEFKEGLGISVKIRKKAHPIEHRFTHRKAVIYPFHVQRVGNGKSKSKAEGIHWADQNTFRKLSFPVPHQKIMRQYLPPRG